MKSLILGLLVFTSFAASAQVRTMSKSADTAVNATSLYLTLQAVTYVPSTVIQLNVVKVSGTVAGTAIVQGSLDGVNYNTFGADTLTLTDASQSKIWNLGASPYQYYRVKYTTSGTQRSVPTGLVLFRKL